jgi:hypothetical protein
MRFSYALVTVVMVAALGLSGCSDLFSGESYQDEFSVANCTMTPTGRNTYFILEPGFQLVLEEEDEKVHITVLNETKTVDGVITRVVEEREWEDGELVEVSRNYFAMCEQTKDVFYFGEDVDDYEDGKVVQHEGAWIAGADGNKAGLIMPGTPKVGMKYHQEIAPKIAMDRVEIISLDETCKTPAGTFSNCMKVKESNPLEFWKSFWPEYKMYAPGIGLVQDEDLVLTKYGVVRMDSKP